MRNAREELQKKDDQDVDRKAMTERQQQRRRRRQISDEIGEEDEPGLREIVEVKERRRLNTNVKKQTSTKTQWQLPVEQQIEQEAKKEDRKKFFGARGQPKQQSEPEMPDDDGVGSGDRFQIESK